MQTIRSGWYCKNSPWNVHSEVGPCLSPLFPTVPSIFLLCHSQKQTKISHIPKCDGFTDSNNYHSTFPKAVFRKFEAIISGQVNTFLEREGRLCEEQYEFWLSRSNGDPLIYVSLLVGSAQQHLFSLGISRAFDRFRHEDLSAKLLVCACPQTCGFV